MKPLITAKERHQLIQHKRGWDALGKYLCAATFAVETASPEVWRRYFEGCMKLSQSPYPGIELAARIRAREYVMKKHGVKPFAVVKPSKAKSKGGPAPEDFEIFQHDFDVLSPAGERIVAIILSGDDGFDDVSIEQLLEVPADYHYVFFATKTGYTWAVRQYRKSYPCCKFVFLNPPNTKGK